MGRWRKIKDIDERTEVDGCILIIVSFILLAAALILLFYFGSCMIEPIDAR